MAENAANQSSFTLSSDSILPLNLDQFLNGGAFEPDNNQSDEPHQSIESVLIGDGTLSDLTNEMFIAIDVPTTIVTDQVQKEKCYVEDQQTITQDNGNDQQPNCSQISCCKGHQKVLNKID